MTDLVGRTALVTGGGRGIGRACSFRLAASGARVAVAARSTQEIERVASEIVAEGHEALGVRLNVADPADVRRAFSEVAERLGPVDILVNNAGIARSAL